MNSKILGTFCVAIISVITFASCKVYRFNSASIPPEVKTVKIGFIENKARYINPQLSPKLTDKLQQKIVSNTRLTRTNNDDAHYQIRGYISDYSVTTAGISNQQAATNRLTVGVHITFLNTLTAKTEEFDISRSFDFSANLSLPQAEGALTEDIIRNITDEIFNRIFSNW
ncbi:MAG: LPS assembly lipoprotein LptE [Chitinophagaceae bacterium]|nr:LPS assembly lipoprotein LptE [Chitinophagaceae bacterium]